MKLYTQSVGNILFYICELHIRGNSYIGQSTISAAIAKTHALADALQADNGDAVQAQDLAPSWFTLG